MSQTLKLKIDGRDITAKAGQTILEAAEDNRIYIPRLCAHPELEPFGGCRVCMVKVNGRPQAACTQPVAEGAIVESETPELKNIRRAMVEMLFVEGNHFCPFCEKSGRCELQALAYRLGITVPRFPFLFPQRDVDMSHPDVFVDRNRCILCARCVRASEYVDGKHVFDFVGRGGHKRIAVNARVDVGSDGLGSTTLAATDRAMEVCPVGCLLRKRVGYDTPVGRRPYDRQAIGADIEQPAPPQE